jgi:hypothetical protein
MLWLDFYLGLILWFLGLIIYLFELFRITFLKIFINSIPWNIYCPCYLCYICPFLCISSICYICSRFKVIVINKECLYINFFIVDFGVQFGVDFVDFVDFGVDFVDFLLKTFIQQPLKNYIFIYIVDFGVDFVDFLSTFY